MTYFRVLERSDDLEEFCVSKVRLVVDDNQNHLVVRAQHASGYRCPRSWRWVPELVTIEPSNVSPRCASIIPKVESHTETYFIMTKKNQLLPAKLLKRLKLRLQKKSGNQSEECFPRKETTKSR